eukprot:667668-Pyramimonas_sp.AAC.1
MSSETPRPAPWTTPGALREDRASAAWELVSAVAMTAWKLRQRRRHAYWKTLGTALPDTLLHAPA